MILLIVSGYHPTLHKDMDEAKKEFAEKNISGELDALYAVVPEDFNIKTGFENLIFVTIKES